MNLIKATIAITAVVVCLWGQYPGQDTATHVHRSTSTLGYQ